MIRFDKIDSKLEELKQQWNNAEPFEYVVIDNFCDNEKLEEVYKTINGIDKNSVGKSRDYMFAKNKLEKSEFKSLSPELTAIYNDFTSDKFRSMVQHITGFADTFIDPDFHGGGIHMGGEGSFLDMHTDFNIHPKNKWTRELNILLYMNPGWKPEYKGQLKLENLDTGKKAEIEPIWNRCVIMLTKGHTKHGYDPINFPKGTYRTTMATYCYTKPEVGKELPYVSTVWYPSKSGIGKRIIGRHWPKLVNMKSKILPSKNRYEQIK